MDTEIKEAIDSENCIEALLNSEVPEPQNPVVVVRKSKKKKRSSGKR